MSSMYWDGDFVIWLMDFLDGKKPRKVFMNGRYRNYHIGGMSITVADGGEDLWIFDFENDFPLMPGDEQVVRDRLGGVKS